LDIFARLLPTDIILRRKTGTGWATVFAGYRATPIYVRRYLKLKYFLNVPRMTTTQPLFNTSNLDKGLHEHIPMPSTKSYCGMLIER
jgi:hypothetical protein